MSGRQDCPEAAAGLPARTGHAMHQASGSPGFPQQRRAATLSPAARAGPRRLCGAVCAPQWGGQTWDLEAVPGITQQLQELQRCLDAARGIHHSSGSAWKKAGASNAGSEHCPGVQQQSGPPLTCAETPGVQLTRCSRVMMSPA